MVNAPRQWFSVGDDFDTLPAPLPSLPPTHTDNWQYLETFLGSQHKWGGVGWGGKTATGLVGRGLGYCHASYNARAVPITEGDLAPNGNSAEVEKRC